MKKLLFLSLGIGIFFLSFFGRTAEAALVIINFSEVNQISAIISGESPLDNGPIRIVWGTDPDNFNHSYAPQISSAGLFGNRLTGLTPVTKYYFKAISGTNPNVSYSAVKSFTTTPASVVLSHADTSDSSVNIFGTITPGNGPVVVVWGKFPLLLTNAFVPNLLQSNFTHVLTDLDPDTTYYYNAINTFNPTLPLATNKSFHTSLARVTINSSDVDDTTVTLSGSTTSSMEKIRVVWGTSPIVFTTQYDVVTKPPEGSATSTNGQTFTATSRTFAFVVKNLSPNVTYYYRVVNPAKPSETYTGVRSVTTGHVTATVNFTNVSDTGATFTGSLDPVNLPLRILYGKDKNTYGSQVDITPLPNGTFSKDITGLIPETTYYFIAGSPTSQTTVYGPQQYFTTLKTFTPTSNLGGETVNSGTPVAFESPTGGLVPCGGKNENGTEQPECNFGYLITMANTVIHFVLFDLAMPVAALLFAYAGWLYLSSGANPGNRTKAKAIFIDVLIGFAIALAAWLIINTILTGLGYTGVDLLNQ